MSGTQWIGRSMGVGESGIESGPRMDAGTRGYPAQLNTLPSHLKFQLVPP